MADKTREELTEEIELLQKRIAELQILDSEHKQQAEDIRRLATVVRDSNDAITIQDFEGRITAWNHGAELMYGYSEKEAFQMNIRQLTPPDKVAEQEELTRRMIMGEAITSFETKRVAKDGRVLDVWLTVTKLVDYSGKPVGIASTERDITERKRSEEALRKSERHYRLLADNVTDLIWTMNLKLQFTYVSPSAKRLFGYDPNELLAFGAKKILKLASFLKATKVLAEELMIELLPRKDLTRFRTLELEHVRKDGSFFWCELVITFLRDEKGKAVGILGVSRDITERKKAEEELIAAHARLKEMQEQLIQSEKLEAIGRLAAGVAHEVRNPLGVILQSANYLEEKIPSGQQEILRMIKDNVKRADNIIRTLVDFSKATQLNLLAEDINPVLERSLILIQHRVRLENIELIKELEEGLPKVLIDRTKIEQVFMNILINAIEAMPQGGKLYIRTYKKQLSETGFRIGRRKNDGDYFQPRETTVVVEIGDTGVGISEDNLKEIFEPFFTTKGPDRGTGLGLSVTKNIIDMHKGLIDIKSKVGEGTKVIISLKVAKEGRHG